MVLVNPYPLWLLLCFHFVYVCRTDPMHSILDTLQFSFAARIFRIVSITLGFYSSTIEFICLNKFQPSIACSHTQVLRSIIVPCEQQCFLNSSAAVTSFSVVNSHENIFNLATENTKTALMAATSKKDGLLKEFLSKWRQQV